MTLLDGRSGTVPTLPAARVPAPPLPGAARLRTPCCDPKRQRWPHSQREARVSSEIYFTILSFLLTRVSIRAFSSRARLEATHAVYSPFEAV